MKIISILSDGRKMNVTDIAQSLHISFKATSNHLVILKNLDVIESEGSSGHVFYTINKNMPSDFKKILSNICV